MITVTVEKRLASHKEPPRPFLIPEGTRIRGLLEAVGELKLQGQVIVAVGNKVREAEYEMREGDAVVLLSVICGG